MKILVTGGTGYIGTHTCVKLVERGHDVCLVDNLSNSSINVLSHLERILGFRPEFHHLDIRDEAFSQLVVASGATAVIHFAALKSVAESATNPLVYFDNNISGTLNLLQAMRLAGIDKLVFSSSATVYGGCNPCPIKESANLEAVNPYGRTKLVMEQMIADLHAAAPEFRAATLRYFNPVGAHASGLIGEDPHGTPNNLVPYISQVAIGRRKQLSVFGSDYPTQDGTGVRDYIHVEDLADAHVQALDCLNQHPEGFTVNLGTGRGYSVLEVVAAFEHASGRNIPMLLKGRRLGDVAECYADTSLAERLLGWKAQYDLQRMCSDTWRWQLAFPGGY